MRSGLCESPAKGPLLNRKTLDQRAGRHARRNVPCTRSCAQAACRASAACAVIWPSWWHAPAMSVSCQCELLRLELHAAWSSASTIHAAGARSSSRGAVYERPALISCQCTVPRLKWRRLPMRAVPWGVPRTSAPPNATSVSGDRLASKDLAGRLRGGRVHGTFLRACRPAR